MKLLFVASEAYPLVKTGGLGDVAYSLPVALHQADVDVRLLLPGYRDVLRKLRGVRILGWLELQGSGQIHAVRILESQHADYPFPLWIVDCPTLFDRPGNPYLQPNGYDWADNAERYTVFARAAAELSRDALQLDWTPDVVHAHDWQTGLVPAFLDMLPQRPQRVFTIHNLAYGGHFSRADFTRLHLPSYWWSGEGAEFYGGFSMLKAGIVYADAVTTVSPTYAREICTPPFGYGMDGLLQSRSYKLYGILNGIDNNIWNPATDKYLPAHYSAAQILPGKSLNKAALLQRFGVANPEAHMAAPLLGMVSRLVEQKGVDLVINAIPDLLAMTEARFVLIGAGHGYFEQRLRELAAQHPDRVFVFIGYDEQLAHLLEAGADMFLMPSRFEPCGLNQMYSLRYGTPPLVLHTGGLADTVVDGVDGFVFHEPLTSALKGTILRAIDCFYQPAVWQHFQTNGMKHAFGWDNSATEYLALYNKGATA
ncbi:MAG: starch synthase [Thiothrix lacustris]|uniref:Glycogen synthase n=1 Tax=Thiothrix lacustris TaxID=525917 RepID=A0A1Y1QX56_9GAMM|nr:MAG: starch synthase [Thiothrix lacustris]